MNIKEKLFCYYYSKLQNHKEAAIKAGYTVSESENAGAKLLTREVVTDCINEILDEEKRDNLVRKSIIGLERLAFGSVSDAVKLIMIEEMTELPDLDAMDLFNISEIKKVKGGGFEIKFFDRIRALEKIAEISKLVAQNKESMDFFTAIEKSAEAISRSKEISDTIEINEDGETDE